MSKGLAALGLCEVQSIRIRTSRSAIHPVIPTRGSQLLYTCQISEMCNQGKLKIPCGKRSAGCSAYVSSEQFCRSFVGCFFSIEDSHPTTGLLLTGIRPLSSPRVPGNGLICKASTAKEPASNPESADPR
eukprot:1164922-Prorocentrum_minimum.AAC.1